MISSSRPSVAIMSLRAIADRSVRMELKGESWKLPFKLIHKLLVLKILNLRTWEMY